MLELVASVWAQVWSFDEVVAGFAAAASFCGLQIDEHAEALRFCRTGSLYGDFAVVAIARVFSSGAPSDSRITSVEQMIDTGRVEAGLASGDDFVFDAADRVAARVSALHSPQLAAGVKETFQAVTAANVDDMVAVWRGQGRDSNPRGWLDETGTPQEMHDRRRVQLLDAEYDFGGVRIVDPSLSPEEKTGFGSSKVRNGDKTMDFLVAAGGNLPKVEVLLPGRFVGINGRAFPGAFGISIVQRPGDGRWVMMSLAFYGATPYYYRVPMF